MVLCPEYECVVIVVVGGQWVVVLVTEVRECGGRGWLWGLWLEDSGCWVQRVVGAGGPELRAVVDEGRWLMIGRRGRLGWGQR